jgi:hypothetical protein
MRTLPFAFALAPLLILAACSSEDRRAGGTTANEAKALEDAAQMLEERQLPAGSVPSAAAQPTAAASPAPSAAPSS